MRTERQASPALGVATPDHGRPMVGPVMKPPECGCKRYAHQPDPAARQRVGRPRDPEFLSHSYLIGLLTIGSVMADRCRASW